MVAAGELGAAVLHPGYHLAFRQDVPVLLHVRMGEGDGAALSLRPADAAWLEDISAPQPCFRRSRVWMADAYALWGRGMIAQFIKSFTLWELLRGHALTLKYFFKPKATINYPYEK